MTGDRREVRGQGMMGRIRFCSFFQQPFSEFLLRAEALRMVAMVDTAPGRACRLVSLQVSKQLSLVQYSSECESWTIWGEKA